MVKLRSGKHVDLGCSQKATNRHKDHSKRHVSQLSGDMKRKGKDLALGFVIFEDDPHAVRDDLVASPLDCWERTAIDQENMEPYAAMGIANRRTARVSYWSEVSSVDDLPLMAGARLSTLGSGPILSTRLVLRQITQHSDDRSQRLSRSGEGSHPAKNSNPCRDTGMQTSESRQPTSRRTRSGDTRITALTKAGIERVNLMNLR